MNRGALYYLMIPIVVMAALFQSTAANRVELYGVKPDVVVLAVVVGALVYGSRPALAWAFAGGIALDVFSGGPMGSSSLALMMAALIAGLGHRTLSRYNVLVPVSAAVLGTFAYAITYLGILAGLGFLNLATYQLPFWSMMQYIVVPAVVYNAALMVFLIPFLNRVPESQDI